MKQRRHLLFKILPRLLLTVFAAAGLLCFPKEAGDGVRRGILLLLQAVIPSLFPFLVLSSFLTESQSGAFLCRVFEKVTAAVFRVSAYGFLPILMGLIGGYPVGAKTVSALYSEGKLTHNETERLLFYCVNPGPAFTVSTVGISMLSSNECGVILCLSGILASLTTGFVCRFLHDGEVPLNHRIDFSENRGGTFVGAVSSASAAMLNISAWVLTFSCAGALLNASPLDRRSLLFLQSVLEITTGCRAVAGIIPLPAIAALLGFGGFAVMFQILPYLNICKIQLKRFISARIVGASLGAFYCSGLLTLFPPETGAAVISGASDVSTGLSFSVPASILLLIMCLIFVLEVDNRKKMC